MPYYFKHVELANLYHVSLKTVHNWIDAARQGKLELELYEHAGRTYIANNQKNNLLLGKLVDKNKKYRNTRYRTVVTPKPEFYEVFNKKQILDIITNLNVHREIPRQYNYFEDGAKSWDELAQRMAKQDSLNMLKGSIELLHANQAAVDSLLRNHDRVNVIDIGPGNGLPVKELLEHFVATGHLHRYIAIDISARMLRIVERNIKKWFGDKVIFEGYVRDASYERFDDLLVDDMLDVNAERTINIAILLGGTSTNLRNPRDMFNAIYRSLGPEDLLLYTDKPDTEANRQYFDFNPQPGNTTLSPNHSFIFKLLNIDESLYDVEMGFNDKKRARYIRVRLKKAITINFTFKDSERHVDLNKGDTILLLRVWHMSALEIIAAFENAGFKLLQSSMTKNRQYLLTAFGIETKPSLED